MSAENLRIVLADDNELVRDTLRSFLSSREGLTVIGEAVCGTQAVDMTNRLKPDVLLLDISMPWINGIAAAERILRDLPGVRIIALSVHNERHYVQRMLDAGASGYVSKDCELEELEEAIRTVITGRIYLSSNLRNIDHPRLREQQTPPPV